VIKLHKISHIDAVIITHGHADACYGLDDLREMQDDTKGNTSVIPVFFREEDRNVIKSAFPYLYYPGTATGSGWVSRIQFIAFNPEKSVTVEVF
jgi:phosphoribosyl 1,2-cyclic phosphodiesterase